MATTTPTAGLTVARSVIVVGCARRVITAMKDGPSHATEPPKRSTASSVRVSPKAATPRSTRTARPPEPPESSSRTAHRPTTVVDSTRLRSIPQGGQKTTNPLTHLLLTVVYLVASVVGSLLLRFIVGVGSLFFAIMCLFLLAKLLTSVGPKVLTRSSRLSRAAPTIKPNHHSHAPHPWPIKCAQRDGRPSHLNDSRCGHQKRRPTQSGATN